MSLWLGKPQWLLGPAQSRIAVAVQTNPARHCAKHNHYNCKPLPSTSHDSTMLIAKFVMEHDKESGHVKDGLVLEEAQVSKYSTVRLQYHFGMS